MRTEGWDVGEYTPLAGAQRFGISAANQYGHEVHRWGDDFSAIALDVFEECARLSRAPLSPTQLRLH